MFIRRLSRLICVISIPAGLTLPHVGHAQAQRQPVADAASEAVASPASPAADQAAHVSSVTVVKLQPDFDLIKRTFETRGTAAVADEIRKRMLDDERLADWREFAKHGEAKISVEIHESDQLAVAGLQRRLDRMGLGNLKVEGVVNNKLVNPHLPSNEEIKYHKWIRYGAGPGITVAASYFNLPQVSGGTWSDYLFILTPLGASLTAIVVVELLFASPDLNNRLWKPLWTLGGPWMGRLNNIGVNFAVGLGLWAAQVGGTHIPELWGAGTVPMNLIGFKQAAFDAAWGAVLFHLFFGQYQTDLAEAEKTGSLTTNQRYKLETTGGVLVGGGRVAYWNLPHHLAYLGMLAQAGFFVLKTIPQGIKNYVADPLNDRRVANQLTGQKLGFGNTCAAILGEVGLINLPKNERNLRQLPTSVPAR